MGVRAALTITMESLISGPFSQKHNKNSLIPAWNGHGLLLLA
jgi:hypothetical protein